MAGEFKFFLSRDISLNVKVKINFLEGEREKESYFAIMNEEHTPHSGLYQNENCSDLYVECQLFAHNIELSIPTQTFYVPFSSRCTWDQWLTFPVKYKDLSQSTTIRLLIWDIYSPTHSELVGCANYPLYNRTGKLNQGRQKMRISPIFSTESASTHRTGPARELDRLEKLIKQHEYRRDLQVEWLERLFRVEYEKIKSDIQSKWKDGMFLHIEFPVFEYPVLYNQGTTSSLSKPKMSELVLIEDDFDKHNPIETMHLKLARKKSILDKDLKPTYVERQLISEIIKSPPTKTLTPQQKEIIWKFRFFLSKDKHALTKFLRCVDWTDPQNTVQGVELMLAWEPIDYADALELLTGRFTNIDVRRYASSRLETASDDKIQPYLLQLVQALAMEESGECPLTNFLISRCCQNFELGCLFYWYLTVETERKGLRNKIFKQKIRLFTLAVNARDDGPHFLKCLKRGEELIKNLANLQHEIRITNQSRPKKIELMRDWINRGMFHLNNLGGLPLPLCPSVEVLSVNTQKSTIFKSAMAPLGICFTTSTNSDFMIIFKSGDDLRQDQLVVQLITLMDSLLKNENLDLKLTPYKVLATSLSEGMLECVTPSQSIASVLKKFDGSIIKYFLKESPGDGDYHISPHVLDNFVKSCAGYCVITYILGIGDRHLDNLMLTPNGNLFHIDFGYILGMDPKPLPPPMKLCKEMVEGMGGEQSPHYLRFKELACEAYNILRKSSNLILNLFNLMLDADIHDISIEKDKCTLKVQEKFRLELTDEEAGAFFQSLINESVRALFPQITETIHRWAQYWRS